MARDGEGAIYLSVFEVDGAVTSSCGDEMFAVVSVVVCDFVSDDDDAAVAATSLLSDADGDLRILFALNGGIGSM